MIVYGSTLWDLNLALIGQCTIVKMVVVLSYPVVCECMAQDIDVNLIRKFYFLNADTDFKWYLRLQNSWWCSIKGHGFDEDGKRILFHVNTSTFCLAFVSCFGDIETGHYIGKNISFQKLCAQGEVSEYSTVNVLCPVSE